MHLNSCWKVEYVFNNKQLFIRQGTSLRVISCFCSALQEAHHFSSVICTTSPQLSYLLCYRKSYARELSHSIKRAREEGSAAMIRDIHAFITAKSATSVMTSEFITHFAVQVCITAALHTRVPPTQMYKNCQKTT